MNPLVMVAVDIVAVAVLAVGLYFRRHRRRDLVLAYVAVNLGVLAVTVALGSGAVGVGLGLGLFGVLSIIRLRSEELDQHEVAYYFVALAVGLVSGVTLAPAWLAPTLVAALLAGLYVADHPQLFGRYRTAVLTLDRALPDERQLAEHLASVLGATVHRVRVRRVNLVEETTVVEVRYEVADGTGREPAAAATTGRARRTEDLPLLLDASRT
jgi:hypothetical protein